eukprot:TRINITY_DN12530_c0_g1_i5.p1 TRINITY_DN12530_c0_g1~~TRINITY_DN12530_c0_g1_i5.p1  ORF type:complete len:391 (-),score=110.06 TRINITY_DN12530_c0_g1_i5:249-1361(-)
MCIRDRIKNYKSLLNQEELYFKSTIQRLEKVDIEDQEPRFELFNDVELNDDKGYEKTKYDDDRVNYTLNRDRINAKKGTDFDGMAIKVLKRKPLPDEDLEYGEDLTKYQKLDEGEDAKKRMTLKERRIKQKLDRKEHLKNVRSDRLLASCRYCLANKIVNENQIVSLGNFTAMLMSNLDLFPHGHFYLIPLEHSASMVSLEEDEYTEIRNFQKALIRTFEEDKMNVVFFESCINLQKAPHGVLEAVVIPEEIFEEVKMYFKKGLLELDAEWSTHKKIIDISKDKGGIRKQIPKGFSYFFIDFDTNSGYAHIVEDESKINRTFAYEIFGDLMDVEKSKVLHPKPFSQDKFLSRRREFLDKWKDFDWTDQLK